MCVQDIQRGRRSRHATRGIGEQVLQPAVVGCSARCSGSTRVCGPLQPHQVRLTAQGTLQHRVQQLLSGLLALQALLLLIASLRDAGQHGLRAQAGSRGLCTKARCQPGSRGQGGKGQGGKK